MKKIAVLSLFLCIVFQLTAQDRLHKRLDSLTQEYQNKNFNGVVLIGKGDRIIYQKAFGFANLEKKTPMSVDRLFKTESVGKMFTATRIMQLVEQGKVSLTDPLALHLPEWKIKNADRITIHHLLNHTSGLTSPWDSPEYNFHKVYTNEELKSLLEVQPLAFEQPGERFYYSNTGYILLGEIIAKFDKKPFDAAMRNSIFKTAGMKKTDHLNDTIMPAHAAQPYFFFSSKDFVPYNKGIGPKASAAGGWIASAEELFRFTSTYMKGAYLQPETRKIQYTANGTKDISKKGYYYSYGFEVLNDDVAAGKTIIGHNGGGAGFSVDAYFEPESGYSVIMCSNMYGTGRSITGNYFNILFNQPVRKVQQGTIIRSVDMILEKGIDFLVQQPDSFFNAVAAKPSVRLLNNITENLAEIKRFEDAEKVLAVAKNMFPQAPELLYVNGNILSQQNKNEAAKAVYLQAEQMATEAKNDSMLQAIRQKLKELEMPKH